MSFECNREKIYAKTGGKCFYCGKDLEFAAFHVDHLDPRSKGGKGGMNLVPACPVCNLAKGNKSLNEFKEHIYRTTTRRDGSLLWRYFGVEYKPFRFWYELDDHWEKAGFPHVDWDDFRGKDGDDGRASNVCEDDHR